MRWLERRLCGYLLVEMQGLSPERFLNLCSANGIEIWKADYSKGGCRFYMTLKGFRESRPFARKSKIRLRIRKKLGLPFFLYRNRRRKLFFAGAAGFFGLLYLMSLFIWDISIEGNVKYTDDVLLDFFESRQVVYGMKKSQVACDELEASIRNAFNEITWVSARVRGTRLEIQIKENEVLLYTPKKDESPCNLVAKKDGVITGMVVRSGKPLVAEGDAVVKGQVLVEGVIPITNDGEEVVATHLVRSDADITARTSYDFTKDISTIHQVDSDTGKVRSGLYLKVFPYTFVYMLPKKEGTLWKTEMDVKQLKIFDSFYLPVYYSKVNAREFVSYDRNYTQEELTQLANQYQNELIEKLMEKGVQIIENNVKISVNGMTCQFLSHLETKEEIGEPAVINETEEITSPDEHN